MLKYLIAVFACVVSYSAAASTAPDVPGVSAALYANPAYTCTKTFYVNGSPSSVSAAHIDGKKPSSAWHTLQAANDSGALGAGDCVSVAPGVYSKGLMVTVGGSASSPAGYLVYRCAQLDACTISDTTVGGSASIWVKAPYVMFDGFTLSANPATNGLYSQGLEVFDGNDIIPNSPFSTHHVWLLNSIVTGYGQSGLQMNDGEYFYAVHNQIYNNAGLGCSAQGSGISFAALQAIPGSYTPTGFDTNNPIVGAIGNFSNVIMYNVLYNNALTACGTPKNPWDTDGNNIILDTLDHGNDPQGGTITGAAYPHNTLVALNVPYNGGGGGIHIYRSANITVANNSCYNSYLDPANNATNRPCIGDNVGSNNTFVNNLSFAIVGPGFFIENTAYDGAAFGPGYPVDSYINNVAYCVGSEQWGGCTPMWAGDTFPCTGAGANQCGVNPGWVDVGNENTGTENTPPTGVNFALKPGSPTIGKAIPQPYLPAWVTDLGACNATLTVCPILAGSQQAGLKPKK